ncbi:MAG: hypothetical protein IT479_12040 [Xanthomonadales bacterium]|nr:hypothetical protein [Xanthomonadales bacterium]MCE7930234.1 hypothetical protein [Xanthomonadales bacterium PRO6]
MATVLFRDVARSPDEPASTRATSEPQSFLPHPTKLAAITATTNSLAQVEAQRRTAIIVGAPQPASLVGQRAVVAATGMLACVHQRGHFLEREATTAEGARAGARQPLSCDCQAGLRRAAWERAIGLS